MNYPPKTFLRFFRRFCHPKLRDSIEGDLMELYDERVKKLGERKADLKFIGDVLLLFRPGIIRPTEGYKNLNNYGMFKSYLIIAWRNLFKHKAFSAINILGLALGMTCSLLIMLWVMDEKSMDKFHGYDRSLYSVFERQYHDGKIEAAHNTPGLLAREMKLKFPEVKFAAGMGFNETSTFEANGKILNKEGNYAEEDFFFMFSYPLVQGTAANALKSPLDIAVSRKMAEDFFGSPELAIGKSIRYQNRKDLRVAAVFENVPATSSLTFEFIASYEVFLENNEWAKDWGNNGPSTFLVLNDGADVESFQNKIKGFVELYSKQENFKIELDVQPYSDIYLHSNFKNGELEGGRTQYVLLFKIVAVFILLIACINFMNLSTARSIKRAKEIGVRKVVGAIRGSLIRQFIGEALLIVFIAISFALLLVVFVLPVFNSITHKQIIFPVGSFSFWFNILALILATGVISGSYPAFYLSGFKPVGVLKGAIKFSGSAALFRKGLVIFQFVLSILLIIGTIVVSKQVGYLQSIHLGYDRQNLIYIPMEGDLPNKYDLLKEQALSTTGITDITRMSQNPTHIANSTGGVNWEGKDPSARLEFTQAAVGYDFTKTMNAQMAEGRDFSKDFASDSVGYIVNETALKLFNYKNPIGMPLTFWQKKGTIVGVIKDFHFTSLHTAIKPMVIRLGEKFDYGFALVRIETGKTKEALANLEKICKELNPKFPFTYQFSDQEYEKLYKSEQVVSKLANVFAVLGILISCLGLLGLAMFNSEQRMKEVSIRKVLGASMNSLFNLLSKELLWLVSISLLIASPLAWIAMNDWLKNYAYRIDISWWMFAAAGTLTITIALVTISFQTIKVLLENPVKNLKSE